MAILWCGGEDIDFPNGNTPNVDTTAGHFNSGYGRCALNATFNQTVKSTVFPGGAITTCWFSFYAFPFSNTVVCQRQIALGLSGGVSGLYIGSDSATASRIAICKFDGTTTTQLAAETGNSIPNITLMRVDLNMVSFGATCVVTLYVNGTQVINATVNTLVTGVTNLDSVFLARNVNASLQWNCSEIIVADEDSRSFRLVTMAPNAAGTTSQWTGAFTNVNPVTINDANADFTNTAAQDQQYNLIDLPAGSFAVKACKLAARAMHTSGSVATGVQLGVNSGGTVNVGTTQVLTTAFATYERWMPTNPVTATAWAQSDMNPLQIDIRSA